MFKCILINKKLKFVTCIVLFIYLYKMANIIKLSFRDILLNNHQSYVNCSYCDNNKQCAEIANELILHSSMDASRVPYTRTIQIYQGGKSFQKGGERLERAFFKCMPDHIKQFTKCNVKPIAINGDIIVEYDLLYHNKKTDTIITFEIKGLNKYTCTTERKYQILEQIKNQQKHSRMLFSKYTVINVICIITGTAATIDDTYIDLLNNNQFVVAIGKSPCDAVKSATKQLFND